MALVQLTSESLSNAAILLKVNQSRFFFTKPFNRRELASEPDLKEDIVMTINNTRM
jgi:hypothetical protein